MVKKNFNKKVVIRSIAALVFLALTFLVNWLFLLPVAVILWLNQRDLFGKK